MNSSGPPGLIPRGQQIINLQSGGTITLGRHGQPVTLAGGHAGVVLSSGNQNQNQANNPVAVRRQGVPPPKLMRLRCRFRPLHDAYIKNGSIVENDADVIFLCGDGHQLKAHKVIMASSSKFFAKIFEDQTNKMAIVSVPDVKVDVMKLILQLTYRDRVILTMRQIKEVGEFITLFGMAWTQFGYEEYSGEEQMSAIPMPPVPMKPVDLPRPSFAPSPQRQQPQVVRKIVNVSGGRITMLQNETINGNEEEEYVFQQQGQGQSPQERHSRKTRLTPRAGTEGDDIVEQDEEEDPESVIQTWMSKLGKRDAPLTSTPSAGAGTGAGAVKRMRVDESGEQKQLNSCSVCRQMFNTETAWRWHEDRHVGHKMFKCKFCDELSNTPKACWLHERDVHGFSGLQFYTAQNQQQQQQQQQQPPQQVTTHSIAQRFANAAPRQVVNPHKFIGSPGQQLSKRIKMQTLKKVQAQKKKAAATEGTKLSNIGIGDPNGSENLPVNKLKQLHWLYVCERCENCADSASKATLHYNRCFPNREKKFEETVKKYRQGFYGKSICPLCSRRYPQNNGFMIHCGHQHQQYRKLFTHIGSEDQLKCNGCKKQFAETVSFHDHLKCTESGVHYCGLGPEPADDIAEESTSTSSKPAPVTRSSSEGKPGRQSRTKRPESPIESKAYKVQFHTPPRSARLASRVLAEAQAETAKANQAKASAQINFPPVDCPVCGDSDLPNISSHLQTKHKDLNVDVTRISSELLRCKGCTITFDICDLLDHKNCMDPPKETAAVADDEESTTSSARTVANLRRSSAAAAATTAAASKPAKPAPLVVDVDSLPPGVGRSPIENIEIEDLHSIQAIRSALKCLICGTTAKKLGVIADCLRAHGIHRCSLCFNSYCNKGDYALHLKKCHGSGSNKLKCPLCPKSFANAGQTSGHMYSTHWLQMLKENEEAMKNEEENAEVKDEEAEVNDKEEGSAAVDTSGSNEESKEEEEGEGVEESKTDKDESATEVDNESGTAEKEGEGEEEEEDDDDEDKMEIDESPQGDETEAVTGTAEDLEKM